MCRLLEMLSPGNSPSVGNSLSVEEELEPVPGYQVECMDKVNGYFLMGPKFYLPSAGHEKPVFRIFVSKQVDSNLSKFFYLHIPLSR